MEQRQRRRYRLTALASFSWNGPDGTTHTSEGYTRDISMAGVFVQTRHVLVAGSLVLMELCFPPLSPDGRGARVRIQGRVVRTEGEGFAVVADTSFRLKLQEGPCATRAEDKPRKKEDKLRKKDKEKDEANLVLHLASLTVMSLIFNVTLCM